MSQRHTISRLSAVTKYRWVAGGVSGLVAGVGMGVVFHAGANLMPFIGALYSWPTVVGGWVVHLLNSALAGLLFAFIVSRPVFHSQVTSVGESVAAGVVFAAAIGLLSTGFLLPISMSALGVQSFPEPLVPLPGMLGSALVVASVGVAHLVYGLLIGWTYATARGRRAPNNMASEA